MSATLAVNLRPLGHRCYGSIPHLPGSRRGPADRGLNDGQTAILTEKKRDQFDRIIVEEKLDGSNCSVAKIGGRIVSMQRAGYLAASSPFEQHHFFAKWVNRHVERFYHLLSEGERLVGEWLIQAHGTAYCLPHEPFVPFDIMAGSKRVLRDEFRERCREFVLPKLISDGPPISIEQVLSELEPSGHGAETVEGAVWRVERKGKVDFLGKYVRPEKVDGALLPEITGREPVWNVSAQFLEGLK